MDKDRLTLTILPDRLAVCRLAPDAPLPDWATRAGLYSITRTPDELSIVCNQAYVPEGITSVCCLRGLKIEGPLNLSMVGVLASLALPLARAEISIFAISTYDTDYLLVTDEHLEKAALVLSESGHEIRTP
ncbi:MAG: ACT domain-containing protein [Anaerolineae bacterium]